MKINTEKELIALCNRNRDGSFSTQAARRDILSMSARQLVELGFYNVPAAGLKQKHVSALLQSWKDSGLSAATLKNRVAHLRWWSEKIGKQNLIPRSNAEMGIADRSYVSKVSKAVTVDSSVLSTIKDERLRLSIELQAAFGLRREECLKFQPEFAMSAGPDKIQLKASWCKGGRAREIPIRTEAQRALLAKAAEMVGAGSMIPRDQTYIQRLKQYENATNRVGMSRLHGLRHEYAQQRYQELTGWAAPAKGGPVSRQLTPEQKQIDLTARLQISAELGHGREAITAVYLGR